MKKILVVLSALIIASLACSLLKPGGSLPSLVRQYADTSPNNPWAVTATGCMAPDFGNPITAGSEFMKNASKYFEEMWQEAGLLSRVENLPKDTNAGTLQFPLSGIDLDFGPPCTWASIPAETAGQYYFVFRSKDGALQKHLMNGVDVLGVMEGVWHHPAPWESPEEDYYISIKKDCAGANYCLTIYGNPAYNYGPIPEFDANARYACFGTPENFVCVAFIRTDWLQISGSYNETSTVYAPNGLLDKSGH